jgi:hypothetical protein
MFVHCCHCRNCQIQTGSAFVLNALIETDRIEKLSGEPELTTVESGSGNPHDIYRCPDCRTAVWSDYGRRPGLRFVRVGTLDDPAALSPDVHIFTRSKLPWVRLSENVHSCEVYYDTEKLWPPESLEPWGLPRQAYSGLNRCESSMPWELSRHDAFGNA